MQDGIVKLHTRLTATHALNGLAASFWSRVQGSVWNHVRRPKGLMSCRFVMSVVGSQVAILSYRNPL